MVNTWIWHEKFLLSLLALRILDRKWGLCPNLAENWGPFQTILNACIHPRDSPKSWGDITGTPTNTEASSFIFFNSFPSPIMENFTCMCDLLIVSAWWYLLNLSILHLMVIRFNLLPFGDNNDPLSSSPHDSWQNLPLVFQPKVVFLHYLSFTTNWGEKKKKSPTLSVWSTLPFSCSAARVILTWQCSGLSFA